MKTEHLLHGEARDAIKETFDTIKNLVVPTMGAKGMLAVLDQDMGQPRLTDDGVTVAKHLDDLGGYNRTIAKAIIEAAHTTEKQAYDGTTLTVLLTSELYNIGHELISEGKHPQVVADTIASEVEKVIADLDKHKIEMEDKHVQDVATIATKIPEIGRIVKEAYDKAGKDMNVQVVWDRESKGYKVEHETGFMTNSGYMDVAMQRLATELPEAKVALLKTGLNTDLMLKEWFQSFPTDVYVPVVYVVTPQFNPESLRKVIDFHTNNHLAFQFVFVTEGHPEQVFMDIAAKTEGALQDSATGIKKYTYDMCGNATDVKIGINRFILQGKGDVSGRAQFYKETLEAAKFKDDNTQAIVEHRLASLTTGVVKIHVGVPTQAAFIPVKLKLDDAIGAVYKSLTMGIVPGAGMTLYNIAKDYPTLSPALQAPALQILGNAGTEGDLEKLKVNQGYDVTTNQIVDLVSRGIVDSYASIKQALTNASSIATQYLRIYMISKRQD